MIKPELDNIKEEISKYIEQDEDVLTYALFPTIALEYFKMRQADKYGFDEDLTDMDNKIGIIM